jgi:predicted TIM-barrel fold metal-dependent hydrolase
VTTTTPQTTGREAYDLSTLVVDTDVHEIMPTTEVLLPYLAPQWHRFLKSGAVLNSGLPHAQPNNQAYRADWKDTSLSRPGSDPKGYGMAAHNVDLLRAQLLEGEGVSIAVLNGFYYFSAQQGWYEQAAAMASAYNDWQIEHWLDKEPRLRGSIHVVAHNPEQAVREIERVAGHPQIVQVFLPVVNDRQYGDPMYHPIYEAAVRNDLAVALHFGTNTQTALGWMRHFIEWHTLAAPDASIAQVVSLVCNGVFDKFPTLKVCVLEAGVFWVPWLMRRMDIHYREFRSEVPWVKRLPSEHIRDNVRFATQPVDFDPREWSTLIDLCGSDRMFMFSTDYPHFDADSLDSVLPSSLPAPLRQRIRCENAIDTYPKLLG